MTRRLLGSLLLACLLTACGSGGSAANAPVPTGASPAIGSEQATPEQTRVLAEGTFHVPSSLISVGAGGLIAVGSGGLVSAGAAHYRLMSTGEVGVPGAQVSLLRPKGEGSGVSAVVTDDQGRYRLTGQADAGAYRLEAAINGHRFMSLANVVAGAPAQAPVSVATTMVASRLLAALGSRDLSILAAEDYQATVSVVQSAIESQGLPEGWTPAQAEQSLAELETKFPQVKQAMAALDTSQSNLESRLIQTQYELQNLAGELGLPQAELAAEVRAVLAANPDAAVSEVAQAVRRRAAASPAAPSSSPASPAPASPDANQPPAGASSPSKGAGGWGKPGAKPTPTPERSATPKPKPSAPVEEHGNAGKGNGKVVEKPTDSGKGKEKDDSHDSSWWKGFLPEEVKPWLDLTS